MSLLPILKHCVLFHIIRNREFAMFLESNVNIKGKYEEKNTGTRLFASNIYGTKAQSPILYWRTEIKYFSNIPALGKKLNFFQVPSQIVDCHFVCCGCRYWDWGFTCPHLFVHLCPPISTFFIILPFLYNLKQSERPVDALSENGKSLTDLLTTWIQEMR